MKWDRQLPCFMKILKFNGGMNRDAVFGFASGGAGVTDGGMCV